MLGVAEGRSMQVSGRGGDRRVLASVALGDSRVASSYNFWEEIRNSGLRVKSCKFLTVH